MVKLFVRSEPIEGVFHLDRDIKKRLTKVMRLKTGDALHVFSPGKHWKCELARIEPDGVELRILEEVPIASSSKLRLTLGQAMPKGDRFDWLIQKATELGITEIFPLITERTIVQPANIDAKVQRWNEIAGQAAGQSENARPTLIHPPSSLGEFLGKTGDSLKLLLHERQRSNSLRETLSGYDGNSITYVVGPEGGWTEEETMQMENAGFKTIHLGSRILRSETAGLVLAAVIEYQFGDL